MKETTPNRLQGDTYGVCGICKAVLLIVAVVCTTACGGGGGKKVDLINDIDADGVLNVDDMDDDNDGVDDVRETLLESDPAVYDVLFLSVGGNANDVNDGTKSAPLATLDGALRQIEAVSKAQGRSLADDLNPNFHPFTIILANGEYTLEHTFSLRDVASVQGGYDGDFGSITGTSRIVFDPAEKGAKDYTIFHLSAKWGIIRNVEVVHRVPEGIPVRAILSSVGRPEQVEVSNSSLQGMVLLDSFSETVTIKDNKIIASDGAVEFRLVPQPLNAALVVGYVQKSLLVASNLLIGGTPPAEDLYSRRRGLFVYSTGRPVGILPEEMKMTIENNQISCGFSSVHSCYALSVSTAHPDISITRNKISGSQIFPSDGQMTSITGIGVGMIDVGSITIADNQIELYDADEVRGISMFHDLLEDDNGETLWPEEATVPGLTYMIRGNTIQIRVDGFGDKNAGFTGVSTTGPVGSSTSVIGNTIALPEGAMAIDFPPQFTTQESNVVTWH